MGFFDFLKGGPAKPADTKTVSINKNETPKVGLDVSKAPTKERLNIMKTKSEYVTKLSISKGITNKSRVAIVLDYSGSMSNLYSTGEVQGAFEMLFPVGLSFDDDQSIDLFAFHTNAYDLGGVDVNNFGNCISEKIEAKLSYGGTNYSPIIDMIVSKYKNVPGDPVYVMFLTDGDCSDKSQSERSIKEASKYGIFFQFVGIGTDNMSFLERLDDMPGRVVDNANFFRLTSLTQTLSNSIYDKLMGEYPDWLKEAKAKNII